MLQVHLRTFSMPVHPSKTPVLLMQVAAQAAKCVAVVPGAAESPYNGASWGDVFSLMQERLDWEQLDLSLQVFDSAQLAKDQDARQKLQAACRDSQMLVAANVSEPAAVQAVQQACAASSLPVVIPFDSAQVRLSDYVLSRSFRSMKLAMSYEHSMATELTVRMCVFPSTS